jgi:hypothetical protein
VFEVGFRCWPGDAERCGGLGQRASADGTGLLLNLSRKNSTGGSNYAYALSSYQPHHGGAFSDSYRKSPGSGGAGRR